MEFFVVIRRSDEKQTSSRHQWTTVILRPSIVQPLGREFGIFAEVDFPLVLAGIQIDGVECSPRRREGGIAIGIEKPSIAGEAIFHGGQRLSGAGKFLVFSSQQKFD